MRRDLTIEESIFGAPIEDRTWELLEDFEILATSRHIAIIPKKHTHESLPENISAALIASSLGLNSLDYAKKRYVSILPNAEETDPITAYNEIYRLSKSYITNAINRLTTLGRPDPTVGIFGASLVLERLVGSFFCAHLLYRLGHKFEGHSVSRLILEQIAWAYAAHDFDDMDSIKKIETTRSIKQLKNLIPNSGKLYGFLSQKTHIDYSSHKDFFEYKEGINKVIYTRSHYHEYAEIIAVLADYFVIVWEITQYDYIEKYCAINKRKKTTPASINPNRSFVKQVSSRLKVLSKLLNPPANA